MYKKISGCPACDMSLTMLKGIDIEIVNVEDVVGKDLGITAVPTFIQGELRHVGFANKEILESKGFNLKK